MKTGATTPPNELFHREKVRLPIMAGVALVTLLTPAYFNLGSLLMSPSRLFFIIIIPIIAIKVIMGKVHKFLLVDGLIFFHVLWSTLAIAVNNSNVAVQFVGLNSAVILGGYLTARVSIRSYSDFIAFCKIIAFVAIISLPFALIETRTGNSILPALIDQIPGFSTVPNNTYAPRMGFYRVQFLLAHPIHYGLFCSVAFGLTFVVLKGYWSDTVRFGASAIIGFCCFLSVSSGPFLSMIIVIFLIVWAWMMKSSNSKWKILFTIIFLVYIMLEVSSDGPIIYKLITSMAFSSSTVNVRRVLLEYGISQIGRTPWLGVGYNSWGLPVWMTGSLDNYWLLNALVFGIPSFLALVMAFVLSMMKIGKRVFDGRPELIVARLGWVFVMISLSLTLATVTVWSEIQSLVFFVFGSGIWLIYVDTSSSVKDHAPEITKSRKSSYTRFPSRTILDQVNSTPDTLSKKITRFSKHQNSHYAGSVDE